MKKLIIIVCCISFISCNQQLEVQLPHSPLNSITEVKDVSPVYMFYNDLNDTIIFNKNNLISTTNWLVNIDKRLTLNQILPHLQYLQEKRQKAGLHKNENAKNYFSCFNPETKGLTFIDFTKTHFSFQDDIVEKTDNDIARRLFLIDYSSNDQLDLVDRNGDQDVMIQYHHMDSLLNNLKSASNTEATTIELRFNSKISFQNYITLKSRLVQIRHDSLYISEHEFIHN